MKPSELNSAETQPQPSSVSRERRVSGARLYVGPPTAVPDEPLLNCVRQIAKKFVSINSAYAFQLAVGEGTPSFSIGIYFDTKPSSHELGEIFSRIGYYMRPFLTDDAYVDLLSLDPSNILSVAVRQTVEPFYKRLVQ